MKRKINNRKLKLGAVSLTVTMLTLAAVIIFNVAFTALAYKVDEVVACNGDNPLAERVLGVEEFEFEECLDECLLCQVVGILGG